MSEMLKPVKPPVTPEERAHWGELRPVVYKDGLGKRVGGWLTGWLSALWR